MTFTGKVNAKMAKFTQNMKDGADNCKLDGKIAEQEDKINVLTKEIGNLTVIKLEAGEEMSPEIMERYLAIKEAKEMISTMEKEKKKTVVVCPHCGAKTSVGMNYCGTCGIMLNAE